MKRRYKMNYHDMIDQLREEGFEFFTATSTMKYAPCPRCQGENFSVYIYSKKILQWQEDKDEVVYKIFTSCDGCGHIFIEGRRSG